MFPPGNRLVNVPTYLRENKYKSQSSLWYVLGAVIICVTMQQQGEPERSACFLPNPDVLG